jgi:4-amino-4-deoxy-L-arabinose transferase-like glycosyltransferase
MRAVCFGLVLAIGLILRLGTAAHTVVNSPIRNDAKQYVAYAWNLKFLGVYSSDFSTLLGTSTAAQPDAERPPGYPLWLAAFVAKYVDAAFIEHVVYAQAGLATLTLLCIMWLAIDVLGAWAGLVVGLFVALSPHQSVYVAYLLSETLFGTVLMLALVVVALSLRARQPGWRYALALVAGACFGLSCLVRLTLNQWVPVLVLLLLVPAMRRRYWREVAALTLGFVLVMSPWWIRNESSLHRLSDSGAMVITLQQGSYPDMRYQGRPETSGKPFRYDPAAEWVGKSWSRLSIDLRNKFAAQPMAMFRWYLFGKITFFYSWSSAEGWGDIFTYPVLQSPWMTDTTYVVIASFMQAVHTPLVLLGLAGMLLAFLPATLRLFGEYRATALRFLALLQLFVIGVHVVGLPIARYSVPFMPVAFLLAIFAIVWLVRRYREYQRMPALSAIHA